MSMLKKQNDADLDRTFVIAERAIDFMKDYKSPAYPRSYEVWYTYVSGNKPQMNDLMNKITQEKGVVTEFDIDKIYDNHLSAQRFTAEAEETSLNVLKEIDAVVDMIEQAVGSTTTYGQSLEKLSSDLDGPVDRARIRSILESVAIATRDVTATNKALEARLHETRGEMESLRETLEAVRVESLTDVLTGVSNRKHFEEMLIKGLAEAAHDGRPMSLIVIDVDHFKRFNDTFGHITGDQVLRLVSQTMRDSVKIRATLARFGGEEFAVILPGCTRDDALKTAEKIRQSVANRELIKRSTGESLGKVTISLGIAKSTKEDTPMSLLERADYCMYVSKQSGRNRTTCDNEVNHIPEMKS
jgi:diguanylate cyclase